MALDTTILLVEDEPAILELLEFTLSPKGYKLKRALDAFARLDVTLAGQIVRQDEGIDHEFHSIMRQLITFMMEDPRTISTALDIVWIAKAIERIGDHAQNIAEYVIFVAKGTDVRHASMEQVDRAVAS